MPRHRVPGGILCLGMVYPGVQGAVGVRGAAYTGLPDRCVASYRQPIRLRLRSARAHSAASHQRPPAAGNTFRRSAGPLCCIAPPTESPSAALGRIRSTFGGRPPEAASSRATPSLGPWCCIEPPTDSPSAALGRIRSTFGGWPPEAASSRLPSTLCSSTFISRSVFTYPMGLRSNYVL